MTVCTWPCQRSFTHSWLFSRDYAQNTSLVLKFSSIFSLSQSLKFCGCSAQMYFSWSQIRVLATYAQSRLLVHVATRKDKIQLNSHICKDSISFTFVEVGNTLPSLSSAFLRATSKFGEALLQNFIINVFTLRWWAWFAVNSIVSHEYGLETTTNHWWLYHRCSRKPPANQRMAKRESQFAC